MKAASTTVRKRHHQDRRAGRRIFRATCGVLAVMAACLTPALGVASDTRSSGAFDPEGGVLGSKTGRIKLIELFDYNCGPCRHVYPDMVELAAAEPDLEIVLIDLPILGAASRDVARVAIAARMQETDGDKFLAFHRKLMSHYGPNDADRALVAAQAAGFDMQRLAQDMASPAVNNVLQQTFAFARTAGVAATPSFVMNGRVYAGEDGFHALRYKIEDLRK